MTVSASIPAAAGRPLTHRDVLAIALPITLSNATVPLVGFVDTLIIGQLGQAALIGGVAIGAHIFNVLYWTFGFLRMGTTGLTAQSLGAGDQGEVCSHLCRALLVAVAGGVTLIVLQAAIFWAAVEVIRPSAMVGDAARLYFDMRIWAAPAGLVNFALLGWFIGLGQATRAFWLQLLLNVVNIALAAALVLGLGFGVSGAGAAALVAEYVAAVAGLWLAARELRHRGVLAPWDQIVDLARLRHMMLLNRDIMIRTLCIMASLSMFTAGGARAGDDTLAANAILLSTSMIAVYLLDGFAFAAETLVGRAIGARTRAQFDAAVRMSTIWAGIFGVALSLLLWAGGGALIDMMTPNAEVRRIANLYLPWAALMPIVGVWCFQLDGIFIGATRSADMRNMMLLSFVIYLAAWALLLQMAGNHGLWASFLIFFAVRAVALAARYPALVRHAFGGEPRATRSAVQ